jgi:hypothetical protein
MVLSASRNGSPTQNNSTRLQALIAQIQETGQISRQDHILLSSTLLSSFGLSDCDRNHINRIFDQIHTGQIKLSDE